MFFITHTATPEIYTLSLHDALPISNRRGGGLRRRRQKRPAVAQLLHRAELPVSDGRNHRQAKRRLSEDRKSTRLNSSHPSISYAVFCLKKKNPSASLRTCHRQWRRN